MRITSIQEMEAAIDRYGILPFFRNDIKGFSIQEMTPPDLIFGGNEDEGCWEWKGPVIRKRACAYGKFFRRKAGYVNVELLPYFLTYRRSFGNIREGSIDEMLYDIISVNDRMTSTELRQLINGTHARRTAYDLPESPLGPTRGEFEYGQNVKKPSRHSMEGPLQRLQMAGRICISDFRYKQTKRGERYGWGVAEYSTPEMLFDSAELSVDASPQECLEYMTDYVLKRFPAATVESLGKLLAP